MHDRNVTDNLQNEKFADLPKLEDLKITTVVYDSVSKEFSDKTNKYAMLESIFNNYPIQLI